MKENSRHLKTFSTRLCKRFMLKVEFHLERQDSPVVQASQEETSVQMQLAKQDQQAQVSMKLTDLQTIYFKEFVHNGCRLYLI